MKAKVIIAILLVLATQSVLLGESFWEKIVAKYSTLSKIDPLESLIDEQMKKLGIPINAMPIDVEKRFGLKYKRQSYVSPSYGAGMDGSDPYCICIDSGGFYIISTANADDDEDTLTDTGLTIFQLNKPKNLVCHKKKVLDISQTFLNKPSKFITDRLKEVKVHKPKNDFFLPNNLISEYIKFDYYVYKTEKEWFLERCVEFAFSESPQGIVDAYYMLMSFEWTMAENAVLQNIQPKVIE
ncbi:MAG: hypothetical protein LBO72_08970 [Helicobacteraceae bacterium]|jgi:hypothetical protein|nr:hypothetical protein [Helicobacteraceae bacterium]